MKIIAGTAKGRNFYTAKDLRPTQSIVRKAFFDMLGSAIEGAIFVDIFAGTGSMGLEALSRGAAEVIFVEKDPKHAQILEENLQIFDFAGQFGQKSEVLNMDAFAAIKRFLSQKRRFDFCFVDPPYNRGLGKKALKLLGACGSINPNCVVAIQEEKHEQLPEHEGQLAREKLNKYGATWLHIFKVSN